MWDKGESLPREELQKIQLQRLQEKVRQVYAAVPFYRQAFDERGVHPDDIKSLDDLRKVPFTIKKDFRDNYPDALFAVPREEIVRVHASSGTTGKPIIAGYTRNDLNLWATAIARTLTAGGLTKGDTVQISYGYGLFTGGLGAHGGAEKIGATVVPTSVGNTKRQITLLQDLRVDAICCTPSYSLVLAEAAAEMGVDIASLPLRVGFFGAEPWSYKMREEIEKKLGILALDIYGLTEIIGPGVAYECPSKEGMHISEDFFYPEVIDPVTEEPLPYGSKGELVFTTLTKEGLPVLRYRTRDITTLHADKCSCGRTLVRMEKVTGRTDDMLIIRGVNVFPSQIESVLLEVEGVEPQYQIIVDRAANLDDIEILVEVSESIFSDEIKGLEALSAKVRQEVESVLGINAKVKLVGPHTIERSEGKAKRVIDRRQL